MTDTSKEMELPPGFIRVGSGYRGTTVSVSCFGGGDEAMVERMWRDWERVSGLTRDQFTAMEAKAERCEALEDVASCALSEVSVAGNMAVPMPFEYGIPFIGTMAVECVELRARVVELEGQIAEARSEAMRLRDSAHGPGGAWEFPWEGPGEPDPDCETCAGSGQVEHFSPDEEGGSGQYSWEEPCSCTKNRDEEVTNAN